jgi:hypothetical protein
MLQFGDYEWEIAMSDRERQIPAWRFVAGATTAREQRAARRLRLPWRLTRQSGFDLGLYIRSEWRRPFVRTRAATSDGRLMTGSR